jgi:hypothetical protein
MLAWVSIVTTLIEIGGQVFHAQFANVITFW